jgi:hypothetical protein
MNPKVMSNGAGRILTSQAGLNPPSRRRAGKTRMEILTPARPRRRLGSVLGGIIWLASLLAGMAGGAEPHSPTPHEIMADYLRVLPAYVDWPTNTFATPEEPWRIGILGTDPFGEALEKSLDDHPVAGRGFEVWHAATLAGLPPCEIIFIAGRDAKEIKKILQELGSRPVLTVSEHDNFPALGGMIQLQGRKPVRMVINLDGARAAGLKIRGRILEVASEVIENGGQRTLKK